MRRLLRSEGKFAFACPRERSDSSRQSFLVFFYISDAPRGWAGLALPHPEFGSSVNPITTRGADYAHHITASPPGFENPAASLFWCHRLDQNTNEKNLT